MTLDACVVSPQNSFITSSSYSEEVSCRRGEFFHKSICCNHPFQNVVHFDCDLQFSISSIRADALRQERLSSRFNKVLRKRWRRTAIEKNYSSVSRENRQNIFIFYDVLSKPHDLFYWVSFRGNLCEILICKTLSHIRQLCSTCGLQWRCAGDASSPLRKT